MPLPPPTPTKCTPANVAAIVARLTDKDDPKTLAEAIFGVVHHKTYYDWVARAAKGEQPYADAVAEIEEARRGLLVWGLRELRMLARSGTKDDSTRLRALTFKLERLFPAEFAAPQKIELTGKDGGPVQVQSYRDALASVRSALAAAGGGAADGSAVGDTAGDDEGDDPAGDG